MKIRILGALLALPITLSACSNASPLPTSTAPSSPTQGSASPTNEPALPQKPESYQIVEAYPAHTFRQPLGYV
jgi:hypothetical protein